MVLLMPVSTASQKPQKTLEEFLFSSEKGMCYMTSEKRNTVTQH